MRRFGDQKPTVLPSVTWIQSQAEATLHSAVHSPGCSWHIRMWSLFQMNEHILVYYLYSSGQYETFSNSLNCILYGWQIMIGTSAIWATLYHRCHFSICVLLDPSAIKLLWNVINPYQVLFWFYVQKLPNTLQFSLGGVLVQSISSSIHKTCIRGQLRIPQWFAPQPAKTHGKDTLTIQWWLKVPIFTNAYNCMLLVH